MLGLQSNRPGAMKTWMDVPILLEKQRSTRNSENTIVLTLEYARNGCLNDYIREHHAEISDQRRIQWAID